jgi:hypothetical protein
LEEAIFYKSGLDLYHKGEFVPMIPGIEVCIQLPILELKEREREMVQERFDLYELVWKAT